MNSKFLRYKIAAILLIALCIVYPTQSHASKNENTAGSAKAMSLGNAITADPPGVMSVHYNPAGLALLDDGNTWSKGTILAQARRTATFKADPDWDGLLETWGPGTQYNPDDPKRKHGGPDPVAETSGTNSKMILYVPAPVVGAIELPALLGSTTAFAVRSPHSRWTFAYAIYAPFAAGLVHDDLNDPLIYAGRKVYSQNFMYASPTVSYELSNTLSVGMQIGFSQKAFGAEIRMRSPNQLVSLTRVVGDATRNLNIPVISQQTYPPPFFGGGTGPYDNLINVTMQGRDDFVPSYNLGLLWRPKNWFAFGLCYQSEMRSEISGDYIFRYADQYRRTVDWSGETPMTMQSAGMLDLPYRSVPYQKGAVTTIETLPQFLNIGFMFRPTKKLKILHDWHWGNWAVGKESRITFDQRIQPLRSAKLIGYVHGASQLVSEQRNKDTWGWSLGLEYQVKDTLKLRCGYEYRPTSEETDRWSPTTSAFGDGAYYGIGAEITKKTGKVINIGFGMIKAEQSIRNNGSTRLNSSDFTQFGNSYNGLDYSTDIVIYMMNINVTMPFEVKNEEARLSKIEMEKRIKKIKGFFRKLNPFSKENPSSSDNSDSYDGEDELKEYLDQLSNQ